MSRRPRDPEAGAASERVTIRLTVSQLARLDALVASTPGSTRSSALVALLGAAGPRPVAPEVPSAPEAPAPPSAPGETPSERAARQRREARVQAVWDRHLRQHPELARALAAAEES